MIDVAVTETTSLVTSAEAAAYFAGRLNADAWDAAVAGNQDKALVTASRQINALGFMGQKKDDTQPHAFPRCYYEPASPFAGHRYGSAGWVCEASIPQAVKEAACEQALFLLEQTAYERGRARQQAEGISSTSMGKASEQADPAQVTKGQWGPRICPDATRLLVPYVATVVDLT